MIPHIIHYCWFGGKPLPKLAKKCIASWQHYFPDWEIREWNETNFDAQSHPYAALAYQEKRWAYLSDIVRLIVVEQYGGIYFDTDVEVIRYPQELISDYSAWLGFEIPAYINTGLGFAATPHHPVVKAMLDKYDSLHSITGCPELNTEALAELGLERNGEKQHIADAVVLPPDYLCPLDDATGLLHTTPNTVSIHWFSKSPHGKWAYYRSKISRLYHRLRLLFHV